MMKRFEIWYANVRFEDSRQIKQRPVLIWNDNAYMVVAYKLTGTDRGDNEKEFKIEHWQEAGLTKPTTIRMEKLLKLQQSDIIKYIGKLDPRDQMRFLMRI